MNLGKLGSVDQSKISKADELKSHGLDEVKVIFTFPDGKTHEQSVSASLHCARVSRCHCLCSSAAISPLAT